jgi:hypothetical protein
MIRFFKILFFLFVVSAFVVSGRIQAATYTAASCNQSDVNAVINGPTHKAVNGDIINIPGGSCIWTSGISISGVGISVIGAGSPNTGTGTVGAGTSSTFITDSINGGATPLFNVNGIPLGQTFRLSLLDIQPVTSSTSLYSPVQVVGVCTSSGCPSLRVDNVNFSGWGGNGTAASWMIRADNVYGVLDHNTVSTVALANINHSGWLGVGQYGDNSWAQPDSLGTGAALYIENNAFTNNGGPEDTDASDNYGDVGGGRVVVRYNNYSGLASSASYFHGTETDGRPRGGRQLEFYNNTIICTGGCFGALSTIRSGVGYIYNNTVTTTGSGAVNYLVALLVLRSYRGPAPTWGSCDGSGPMDKNDGVVYASGTILTGGTLTVTIGGLSGIIANQWVGSNGSPYSLRDTTQGFGVEIASNTATLINGIAQPINNTNSPLTWNTGDSFQILRSTVCVDQPGRGAGALVSGDPVAPTGWVSNTLDPVYEWNDTVTGTAYNTSITANGTNRLIANRDFYYDQKASFNGTVGTGEGLLAARPNTCTSGPGGNTPGVAYWATDANTLYICNPTNTWTASYRPYTYPHPLIAGGSGGSGGTVYPPTNIKATAQ